MSEKLIVTLWRGEIRNCSEPLFGVYCLLHFGKEERRSKTVHDIKLLPWKETFVFTLPNAPEAQLKLEFINLREGEQIHFSQDHLAESIRFARASAMVPIEKHNTKGTIPKKLDILNEEGTAIGKVFLEYELLRTEVKYMVEKPIEYNYLLCVSQIKVSFVRNLKDEPVLFLQATFGDQTKKEEFPMTCINGDYLYSYPVKFYLKNEQNIRFELVGKSGLTTHIAAPVPQPSRARRGADSETESKAGKGNKKKLSLESTTLFSVLDLIYSRNGTTQEKIPLYIPPQREIGYMQFQAQVIFKTKEELKEQQKKEKEKHAKELSPTRRKQISVVAHNGNILVNSIIARLQPFNEELIRNKDFHVELKIGKQVIASSVLQNPGRQLIFIDNFKFKRTWEEKLQFAIIMKDPEADAPVPLFFTEANLRELFESGRFLAKHLVLVDEDHNYSGEVIVDVSYQQEKKKETIRSTSGEKDERTQEEIKELEKQVKLNRIKQRMQKREEAKLKRSLQLSENNHSLLLPAISERDNSSFAKLSPGRRRAAGSVSGHYNPDQSLSRIEGAKDKRNIYNKGHDIKFSRSPRFPEPKQILHNDPFFYRRESDFEMQNRGASIGYGDKMDFTRNNRVLPGVGRYQIPSLWDKYN